MDNTQEFIRQIALSVIDPDEDVPADLFESRLGFLYAPAIEAVSMNKSADISALIREIISFEKSQFYVSVALLRPNSKETKYSPLTVFSMAAFGLAVERLKGNNHEELAALLHGCFDSARSVPDLLGDDRVLISETTWDFMFAAGETEKMSLRLKKQWDLMK